MMDGKTHASAPAASSCHTPAGLTHAGGVVFRKQDEAVEYLLVQANKERGQWVLPKGHIEPGETPRETAVREVYEETGHWACVIQWIDDLRLDKAVVRFYLMECLSEGKVRRTEERGCVWLPLAEAKTTASFDETKSLLEKAETVRATSRCHKKTQQN